MLKPYSALANPSRASPRSLKVQEKSARYAHDRPAKRGSKINTAASIFHHLDKLLTVVQLHVQVVGKKKCGVHSVQVTQFLQRAFDRVGGLYAWSTGPEGSEGKVEPNELRDIS